MTTVEDVMSTTLVMADSSATVAHAATVMGSNRVSALLVTEDDVFIAIFTERDVLHALSEDFAAAGTPISHWMTKDPATTTPGTSVEDALKVMLHAGFRHLPVRGPEGKLVGVVSIRDLGRAIADD